MSVYTVHQPPARGARVSSDAERLVFVRDSFSFWAFILTPLWMLWHRMWLVFIAYLVVTAGLIAGLAVLGASQAVLAVVGLLISLLVGLESSTLRRVSLWRRGWTNIGVVGGDDLEDAERRFFGAWLQQIPSRKATPPVPPPLPPTARAAATMPRTPRPPDVIGLFPEPGGHH